MLHNDHQFDTFDPSVIFIVILWLGYTGHILACSRLPTSEIAGRGNQPTATSKNLHKNLLIFSR